jgi:uncharacterized protein (TIGR00255 family)
MTGFGRAEINAKIGRFTVEVSSINSRFLESIVRLPKPMSALEPQVRELITGRVQRGKVSVFVGLAEPEPTTGDLLINKKLLVSYFKALKRLQKDLKIGGEISVSDLLLLPDLARPEKSEPDLEAVWPHVRRGLEKALGQMLRMRAREGKVLVADMRGRLETMHGLLGDVEKATRGSAKQYAQKLAHRIDELLNGQKHDPVRLEEEIAIFADRADITEECTRFRSHLNQFKVTLGKKEAVGRRLNFILQEMNREVNTIGSKGSDFNISTKVISLKEEIEKLREQVQNVE